MHNDILPGDGAVESVGVADIARNKARSRSVEVPPIAHRLVVEHGDVIAPMRDQMGAEVDADEPGPACDEDIFHSNYLTSAHPETLRS